MPVYFTLQEALSAAQSSSRDYNPVISGGPKPESKFVQKPEIKLVVNTEPVEPVPIIIQEDDPDEDPTKHLQDLIEQVKGQQAENEQKLRSREPGKEPYKEPPSLIVGASFVLIDPIRADAQDIHGAQAVQARYAQQNDEAWVVKPFAKKSKEAKKSLPKVGWTTAKIAASSFRHPIATAQNMVRDPFENRDIHFTYTVNEMVKKKLFPNNPEMALLVPDSFIDKLLVGGREKRNQQGLLKKNWNAFKDFLPTATTGFVYDTQQKRALEYLGELMTTDPDGLLRDIENITMEGGTKLAKRFSQTFVRGDDVLLNQVNIGNNHILLPGEKREQIKAVDEVTHQDIIETKIKEKIKPFVDRDTEMTLDEKKQLVKEVTQIYIENVPKDKLDQNGKPKGEAVVDVLDLIAELKKDPDNREYYQKHWPELKIISYIGESKGDTLGGQERFLTWNQKLAIKCAKNGSKLNGGWTRSAVMAAAKIGVYTSGFALSYGLGVAKLTPRTGINGILLAVSPFLGPGVAGATAGLTETQSVHLGKIYQRRSRIDNDLARTSRGKALGEKPGELDAVRGNLEDATVETVPAEALTTEINKLILVDQNNFGSETRVPANKEEVLQLLTHMAHARARLEQTMMSGSKDLNYKTSNWVSYHAGREQEELTNLTGASCQAFARLLRLQVENLTLFDGLPFLPTPDGDLNEALKSMTTVIKAGLMEGLPSELIDGSPLSTFKGQKFYKQIFNASGIPDTETDQVFNFINSLKTTSKVGIKTVGEWMDEAESYKSRMKALEKIRNSRFRFAALTGIATSEIIGGLKHVAQPSIDQVEAQFNEHVIQPILHPNHTPVTNNPAPNQSPDQSPAPAQTETTMTIDLPNMFKEPSNGVVHMFKIFNEDTGKTADVKIPLADGYKFLPPDGDGNIDIIKTSDGTVLDNVFILDQAHGALIPNPHFVPDASHPTVEVDLGQHIDFKTEQIAGGGEPVELTGSAAIVDYLKTHYQDAMTELTHRNIYDGEHALTTFVDSEGKVHITQGGYTAPNIAGGSSQSLTGAIESGNGSLFIIFGKNADRPLSVDNTPLSFEGIKLPLTWHAKGDGGYGEFIFDPLHPNPNSPQEILFAKLIDQNALQEFKAMGPNHWLNEQDLGKLLMGVRGIEGGFMTQDSNGELTMNGFEVDFAGENNKLTIAPPESTIPIETTSLIPPGKIDVPIPVDTILEPEVPPIQPTPTNSTVLNAFPGPYHSPQLHPTTGETPIPASSTPLPQSIINVSEFKKEVTPRGYNNQEAKKFLEYIAPGTGHQKINEFIEERVFNNAQREFIRSTEAQEFIRNDVYQAMHVSYPRADEKIRGNNTEQLTDVDKAELKRTVLQQGKVRGLTEQEALTVNTYLVNRSYLTALGEALIEKKSLDEEFINLNHQLQNSTRLRRRSLNPKNVGSAEKARLTDDFIIEIADQQLSNIELSNAIGSFVIEEILDPNQRQIIDTLPQEKIDIVQDAISKHKDIDMKMHNDELLNTEEKKGVFLIISQILEPAEATAYYNTIIQYNSVAAQVKKKIEEKMSPSPIKKTSEVILPSQETHPSTISTSIPKPESIRVTPEQNLKASQVFCHNLRENLKNGQISSYDDTRQKFTNPESGIYVNVINKKAIDTAWFTSDTLTSYAQKISIPLALYLKGGNHFTLLLKGPEKQADGQFRILLYNPFHNTEEWQDVPINENFQLFRGKKLEEMKKFYDPQNQRYNLPGGAWVPEGMINQYLYDKWFKTPTDQTLLPNDIARNQLISGSYNLSILEDTELPAELKLGKTQQFQSNGWDCGPLSLYTAILRYSALPGNEQEKQKMVATFASHFGVRILTRKELLGR